MANPRSNPGFLRYVWLAALSGVVLSGGSPLFGQAAAQGPPGAKEQVVEVRIEGNRTVPQEKILRHIRTRAGRPFDLETIEEDVRRLNRTRMFVNVETLSQRVPGGRVVVYRVLERPILQEVHYVGNRKIKDKVLREEADLKVGDAADPFAVEEGRRRIEEFYRSKGFSKVCVTVVEGNKPGDRRAIYLINEGRKQRILWTSFVGNTIASDSRLRTQIQSKPGILWFINGEVDRKQIDEDANRLTAYYRSLGFFRARIGRELTFNENRDWLTLTFVIDEGPRYKIRNVSFIGNKRFATEELAAELSLKRDQYFNQKQMAKDVATIREKYGGIGYIFADVKADPRFLEEPAALDLLYDVGEGDRYRVGRINVEIKGEYPHTKITTVLNRISLKPGDIVDIRKLRASERRLRASGLFLVEPRTGAQPKIVFSPPELGEEEAEIAQPPTRGPKVRGQSVDLQPCDGWKWAPSPDSRPGDRRVDFTLPCRVVYPDAPPQAETPSRSRPQPHPNMPAVQPSTMVVRGQSGYNPEGGWSVPEFQPSVPQVPAQVPPPNYGGRPPAGGYSYPPPTGTVPAPAQIPAPIATPRAGPPYAAPATTPAPAYGNPWAPGPRLPYPSGGVAPSRTPVNEGIFSEDSPFLGGPPDDDFTRPLPLDVITEETQTGRLMFGVGVNSDAGLIGSIVIDEQNFDWTRSPRSWEEVRNATAFRGAGQRFRIELIPGTQVQRYMATFQEPYLFDTAISLGLSGYFYDRRYIEWDEQRLGGRVSWGYQFTHDLSGSFAYRGAKINVHDPIVPTLPELMEVEGDNALHGFQVRLAHDTRDSAFLATEGHLLEFAIEQVVGSFDYPRVEMDVRRYFLIHERPDGSGRHVLSLSGRAGYTGDNTPIYDHYYAGGFSTIRGFDFRGASPRDPATRVLVGGHFMLLAGIQYMFPITADDMLRAVVFCDTGTVEPTIDDWRDNYRVAPGFGLRITVPAMGPAPIALDFAFPMRTQMGDEEEVFSFFVGFNH